MNETILLGRFVKTPELRKTTTHNKSVTSFTLAVDKPYRTDGEIEADFFDCTAWDKNAENICKYFDKGDRILISGRLGNRPVKYTNKNNVEISYIKTIVDVVKFDFIERKRDKSNTTQDGEQHNDTPAPVPAPPQNGYFAADMDNISDDDYPF